MDHGFRKGILRLAQWSRRVAGTHWSSRQHGGHLGAEALAEHELRDLGILDGRVSPSSVRRHERGSRGGVIEEAPPRWL